MTPIPVTREELDAIREGRITQWRVPLPPMTNPEHPIIKHRWSQGIWERFSRRITFVCDDSTVLSLLLTTNPRDNKAHSEETQTLTSVRVQQMKDLSIEDMKAEGHPDHPHDPELWTVVLGWT